MTKKYSEYTEYMVEQAKKLLSINSPSGYGREVMEYLLAELEGLGVKARKTVKGGVLAELPGGDPENALLLEAHCDTLGAMVHLIKDNGHLKMTNIGGMQPNNAEAENVTVITKSGKTPEQVISELVDYLRPDQSLFVQSVSTDFEGIMEEARYINALRPENTYVKIPVTREGMKAIKAAKAEGLNVLATAIYSADEAFMAALNGADYLAPYVNRMCNYGDGVGQVIDLIRMIEVQGLSSKIVAASFKSVEQVHELIAAGIQAVTVQPDIVRAMIDHPGTEIAVGEFTDAWDKTFGRKTLR